MDHNQERRQRGHFHRGRRGPDRRGPERSDRRTPPPQGGERQEPQQQVGRDHVDVEQIMRDIRARIGQRQGLDLSNQQIQELAARRLEAILDPRSLKPGLLDELRRSAGAPPPAPDPAEASELNYSFEDTTLYESHRGLMRFFRKLLNPILKLFFNPNPLIRALNIQARVNTEMARKLAERDRRQTEWNALHFELVQRMASEVAKVSLELQALTGQIESLSAKVDFNERRVRGMEATTSHQSHQPRPQPARSSEPVVASVPSSAEAPATEATPEGGQPSESTRRRRRRRRGRRGSGAPTEGAPGAPNHAAGTEGTADVGGDEIDEPGGDEGEEESAPMFPPPPETAAAPAPEPAPVESASAPQPVADVAAIETVSVVEAAPPEPVSPEPAPPTSTPEHREPQG